jgi:Lon protease-like protein
MSSAIVIDFDQPIGLFPTQGVVLYPQTVHQLHVQDARFIQLIEDCLESAPSAPIALAVGDFSNAQPAFMGGELALRPVVCICRIIKHHRFATGDHVLLVHGLCRAQIQTVYAPDFERHYPQASLRPIESNLFDQPSPIVRDALRDLLTGAQLSRMQRADIVRKVIDRNDVPVETLIEMVSFELMHDDTVRYQLLAEPDPSTRARIVHTELERLDRLIAKGDLQQPALWPKGLSWN